MYIRTTLNSKEIKSLTTNRVIRLNNCITRYTMQILEPVTPKENDHFICLAKMVLKQRKIKKKTKLFGITWGKTIWEKTILPEKVDVILDFAPTNKKVRILEKD